jgi:cell division protein FtsB
MEKIKYLIIFTLLLVIGILYFQLENHQKLTDTLIIENNTLLRESKAQEEQITELNDEITVLNDQILSLEDEKKILLENTVKTDTNTPSEESTNTTEQPEQIKEI